MAVLGIGVELFNKESVKCDLFIYLFFSFCRFCMCNSPAYVQLQFTDMILIGFFCV